MPYYQGDYYQGDYYQGDLFGVLKRGIGIVAGGVKGFLRGGPVGALSGAAQAAVKRAGKTVPPAPPGPPMIAPPVSRALVPEVMDVPRTTPGAVKQPGISGAIERFLPFGETGYVSGKSQGIGAWPGFHWNKSYSYAKGLPAGSFLVRNRSMNPLNPRALRRTVRRQRGAVGLMRAVLAGSGYTIKRSGLPGKKGRGRRR